MRSLTANASHTHGKRWTNRKRGPFRDYQANACVANRPLAHRSRAPSG
jgi:hypothetical protein